MSTGVQSMYIKYMLSFSPRLTILFYHYVSVVQCSSSEKVYNYCKKNCSLLSYFFNLVPSWDVWQNRIFLIFSNPLLALQATLVYNVHILVRTLTACLKVYIFFHFPGPFTSYKYFIIYPLLSAVQEIRDLLPATFLKTGIPAQQRFQIRQGNEYSNTKEDFFLDCLMRQISTMLTKIDRCWP